MNVKVPANIWEKFAKENAEFYILTEKGIDYSLQEGRDFFFNSGKKFTKETVSRVEVYLNGYGRALEIGCGTGRLTFPHSKLFDEVYAVDISPTMLEKLAVVAKDNSIFNIKTCLPHENWDRQEYFDYAFSFIVFQHIKDLSIIENYIHRTATALKNNGIAQLQFDTRPVSFPYRLRNLIPDCLLPKTQRKGIRRIRRDPDILRELFKSSQLDIIDEIDDRTEFHTFLLRKT